MQSHMKIFKTKKKVKLARNTPITPTQIVTNVPNTQLNQHNINKIQIKNKIEEQRKYAMIIH